VEQRHRDWEAHPEGVDRPRALEQERLIGIDPRTPEEPTRPLGSGPRNHRPKAQTPRTEQSYLPHVANVTSRDDTEPNARIGGAGRIRTRDTRVKSPWRPRPPASRRTSTTPTNVRERG